MVNLRGGTHMQKNMKLLIWGTILFIGIVFMGTHILKDKTPTTYVAEEVIETIE